MKQYSIFQIPLLSFYCKDVYRDMALNKQGIGFGYLFLLLALCWLVLVSVADSHIDSYLDKTAPALLAQFPAISIFNGQASINETQPYYIRDPETGESLAVIDTTGLITSMDDTDAPILMTKNAVMVEKSDIETRTFDLSEIGNIVIDRELLTAWTEETKSYLGIIIYPFALMGSFLYRVVQVLIYAFFGMVLASMCKAQLDYSQLLRLSVVAVTPGIIINTFLWSFGIDIPMSGLMFFLLAMVYLHVGIKSTLVADTAATND